MKARDLSNEDLAAILRSICVTGICPSRDEKEYLREAADRLEQKPETVTEFADRCRECGAKYGKLLNQEPCDDAISRKYLLNNCVVDKVTMPYVPISKIQEAPLVTQKSGKWILLDECANSGYYCSRCQKKLVKEGWSDTVKKIKFCPNCGAKMVEPQESEDKE